MADSGLLLDTHVWIWMVEGKEGRLSRRCLAAIDRARAASRAFVSAVSVREAVVLAARGRLRLTVSPDAWARRALVSAGFRPLVLDPEAAALSAHLGANAPRDPIDQILIATAMLYGLTLVTRDAEMLEFGRAAGFATLDAGP